MFFLKKKSYFLIVFTFVILFGEVCLNYSDYIAEQSEVVCERGRIESFSSPRSSATLFYAMESGVRFYAESFNRNEGASYTSVVNGEYSFNQEPHTLCYLIITRFFYFDVYYVVYFGDYSNYLKNHNELMSSVGAANFHTYIYIFYLILCFVGFIALVRKIQGFMVN
ncbi:hypothetical protein MN202_11995 [Rheinheimera muenzenbergensis]|uniref:Transmembrane protein n=1 Tax=Rheinheimera muenzenbergensis TaxID=1193628 RepID=A0ABU8C8V2_9GAMM